MGEGIERVEEWRIKWTKMNMRWISAYTVSYDDVYQAVRGF